MGPKIEPESTTEGTTAVDRAIHREPSHDAFVVVEARVETECPGSLVWAAEFRGIHCCQIHMKNESSAKGEIIA